MKKKNSSAILIIALLIGLLIFVWAKILLGRTNTYPAFYFLDVGQGDSELVLLPGNIKIMTDAGPDQKVVPSLERAFGDDRYIDIGIISHPQLDHFNGFNYLLDTYTFGAFIINGRNDTETVREWPELIKKIQARNIPLITLGEGDTIRQGSNTISILSPGQAYIQSGELNDTGFVERIEAGGARALLVADIGTNIETYLKNKFDIAADILKVGHHGSKYSSSEEFLKAVNPKIAVIEVGKNNRYGHPVKETLERLSAITKNIVRTDDNGTIKILIDKAKLSVFAEHVGDN